MSAKKQIIGEKRKIENENKSEKKQKKEVWMRHSFKVGQKVYCIYPPDGRQYSATIDEFLPRSEMRITWFNDNPKHRIVKIRESSMVHFGQKVLADLDEEGDLREGVVLDILNNEQVGIQFAGEKKTTIFKTTDLTPVADVDVQNEKALKEEVSNLKEDMNRPLEEILASYGMPPAETPASAPKSASE